jgi:hypothetical protein
VGIVGGDATVSVVGGGETVGVVGGGAPVFSSVSTLSKSKEEQIQSQHPTHE